MPDLFTPQTQVAVNNVSRTKRQKEGIQKWVNNALKGTLVYPTGAGKTYTAIMAIERLLTKNPEATVLIVVPTDTLKVQWMEYLVKHNLLANCEIVIINSAIKRTYNVSLLIIDECHKAAATGFSKIFNCVKYKAILCLTATLERLDGEHTVITSKAPVIDRIELSEAIANGWVSGYREYLVLLDVDLTEYTENNKKFYDHFSYFDNNFSAAMNCCTDYIFRNSYAKKYGLDTKSVIIHAMGFNRALQARKKFINNHPKKIEIANLILEHRQDKKCITFSNTISMAEKIKYGKVYSGKDTKKKGRMTIGEFLLQTSGVLNSSQKLNEGFDDPNVSIAIIMGFDSNKGKKQQRIGRIIRKTDDKVAEVFSLVLKGTAEEQWHRNSSNDYTTINEENLINLLKGEEFRVRPNKEVSMLLRF